MQSVKKITVAILVCTLIFSLLTGCGGSKEKNPEAKQQSVTGEQGDKVPDDLTSIENSIESIFLALNGPAVQQETTGKQDGTQGGQQSTDKQSTGQQGGSQKETTQEQTKEGTGEKQKEGQSGKESQSSNQGGQQKGQQGQQQTQQKMQAVDPWQQITPIVNTMHYKWNSYMPMAVKMGANRTLVDNFGSALNSLTNTLINKNIKDTMLSASKAYAYIPEFYSLYRTGSPPEIKRIRHYVRNSMLNAMMANWTQSEADIKSLNSSWQLYKSTVSKDQQEDSIKLDFSIYELAKVITEKNQPLTDIKGRVTLSNVQSLEKAQSKTSGGQGGQGQSGGQSGGSSGSGGSDGSSSGSGGGQG